MLHAWLHDEQRGDMFFPHYPPHAEFLREQQELGVSSGLTELESYVILSWFTDRVAPEGHEMPLPNQRRSGYWRDPQRGSLFWLAFNKPINATRVTELQVSAYQALEWMIDEAVVSPDGIDVRIERQAGNANRINALLALTRPDGQQRFERRYDFLWQR